MCACHSDVIIQYETFYGNQRRKLCMQILKLSGALCSELKDNTIWYGHQQTNWLLEFLVLLWELLSIFFIIINWSLNFKIEIVLLDNIYFNNQKFFFSWSYILLILLTLWMRVIFPIIWAVDFWLNRYAHLYINICNDKNNFST